MSKIRIGIVGYGNLGRGVEASVKLQPDMELVGVFSRRKGLETVSGVPTYTMEDLPNFKGKIDVMVLCGGSATDLIEQTPMVTKYFNCIDSFDTHARIPEHFANVDKVAKEAKTATLIGVLDARQYTVPKEQYLEAIRNGETPDVDGYKGHLRECYVVAAPDTDKAKIENEIKTMENYFVGYETVVNFISQEELDRDHKGIPHGGFVLRSGESTDGTRHVVEYSLKLDSNPEFTGSALVAYARGIYRLAKHGGTGCYTVFDIPPAWISTHSAEELRAHSL